ncbi:hypothetical protein [Paraburkholderia dinghuensis]|uniref:Uncharacterized protein n=1 Tax=Paraburkholderia dinghuensis TaxID=2305225 RepID=A0A3N6P5B8_9BURK|nr:hypothetical protein [Paraburkholderia dinghuensis]RQH08963.1 hypothetical protein D1Y85_03590 [Paraburkholderia dinghuensis]
MSESIFPVIFAFVAIIYWIAVATIMAFWPERLLAFYCRSRVWRWQYRFLWNKSPDEIMSAKMVRRTRFQGLIGLAFVAIILFGALLKSLRTDTH